MMTFAYVLLSFICVVLLALAVHVRTTAKAALAQRTAEMDALIAALPRPPAAPASVAPSAPAAAVPVPTDRVTCRFVSERGRVLGAQVIERKHHRPTMTYTVRGKAQTFVLEKKAGRELTYRRVGTERT